ncbi:glycosyl transferase [Globomyces pollinis-pini]|nr:glycosyl transferase [Globomyces pollinis-pini]
MELIKILHSNWKLLITLSILLKWSISLSGYSGMGNPPLFGDFEAQRHWLEITYSLPITSWYFFDLNYWGLDYPPLTAFHSYLLGYWADKINPSWVELNTSRGSESKDLKSFMRLTALLTDNLIFLPASLYYIGSVKTKSKYLVLFTLLFSPALNIIDHGHFQYNSAMLGFSLGAIALIANSHYCLGSMFFVMSLLFKQMALFFALPFFFYLLSVCFHLKMTEGFYQLLKIGITVIFSFAIPILPFIYNISTNELQINQLFQILHRVFPVARGLYEDKVANFWCAVSVVIKLREIFSLTDLIRLSIVSTLIAVLPSCVHLFLRPQMERFIVALAISSLGFFLFSFQVHEKSILLPLLPINLLYLTDPTFVLWFNNSALYSLWPLLKKDGLLIPYISTTLLWNLLNYNIWKVKSKFNYFTIVTYMAMLTSHILEYYVVPPPSLPHIHILFNVLISASCFSISFLYLYGKQFGLLPSPSKMKID